MKQHEADVIREFLVESHENLARLDQELVDLEKRPEDTSLLASIFRTMHTIKGTCGFLGYRTLERLAHQAETILSQLRDRKRDLTPFLVSLILECVDATRQVLASIEACREEGAETFDDLNARLCAAAQWQPALPAQDKPVLDPAAAPQTAAHPVDGGTALEENGRASTAADSNIRVGVGLLDKLMDLVGELVLIRNQIVQFDTEREDSALSATSQRLNLITTELQEGVMKTRMQPIGMVWNKLPRVVRDMAVGLGKRIRLEMDGTETELDRTIIEAIKDPLIHLVRNCCDHGIEAPEARIQAGKPAEGKLFLRAYHEGGQVNIEIADDGAGIDVAAIKRKALDRGLLRPEQVDQLSDREALNLIFLSGLSTAAAVTKVSGRGVGMDVVKSNIERIGGVVDVTSRPGEGTTVKLKIPLTLAIIPGLVITSGAERFVIPQVSLLELVRLEGEASERHIEHVHGTPVYRRRGSLLPIAYLNQVLGLQSSHRADAVSMVVLQAEDRQFGLVVDGINDTQEIVVKPLGKQLKRLTVYAGATIMGDGRVALILDVLGIGQQSGVLQESREQSRLAAESRQQSVNLQQRLLLFRAGSFERLAVPLSLVARLEEFPRSTIENAGGRQVVQYRNSILSLIPLRDVLEGAKALTSEADPVQVIVFSDGERSVGLIVDQILDVVEEAMPVRQNSHRPGLLGSAVVGQRITDFLDLNHVLQTASREWFQGSTGAGRRRSVLLAEPSGFSRCLIRSSLDMAGYQVLEAADVEQAVRALETQPVDIVVTALALPPVGSSSLLAALRHRPEWTSIPVLALADSTDEVRTLSLKHAGYGDCQTRFDRAAMLESIARLASALEPVAAGPACQGQEF